MRGIEPWEAVLKLWHLSNYLKGTESMCNVLGVGEPIRVQRSAFAKIPNIWGATYRASLVTQTVNNLPAMQETWVWSLGQEEALEKGMATHSSILAWRIPGTEEPGGLQPMGSQSRTWLSDNANMRELQTGGAGFVGVRPAQSLTALGSGELILGSVGCCRHLEILNNFWTRSPAFS